jgi:hypothetical protein
LVVSYRRFGKTYLPHLEVWSIDIVKFFIEKKHNKNALSISVGHSIGHHQAELQLTLKIESILYGVKYSGHFKIIIPKGGTIFNKE